MRITTQKAHRTFKVKHCGKRRKIKHAHKHTIGRCNKTGESLRLLSPGWRRKIHPTSQRVLINHGLTGSNCLCWVPHLSPSDGALCPTTAREEREHFQLGHGEIDSHHLIYSARLITKAPPPSRLMQPELRLSLVLKEVIVLLLNGSQWKRQGRPSEKAPGSDIKDNNSLSCSDVWRKAKSAQCKFALIIKKRRVWDGTIWRFNLSAFLFLRRHFWTPCDARQLFRWQLLGVDYVISLKMLPLACTSGGRRRLNTMYKLLAEGWGTLHLMNIISMWAEFVLLWDYI